MSSHSLIVDEPTMIDRDDSYAWFWKKLRMVLAELNGSSDSTQTRTPLIECFIALGLRTFALEELDRAGSAIDHDQRQVLVEQIRSLPDDLVLPEQRLAILKTNLSRIDLEGFTDERVSQWRERAKEWAWYRAADGHIVRQDTSTNRLVHLEELRTTHHALIEPVLAQLHARCSAPIVLEGADPPWMLKAMLDAPPPASYPDFRQRVLVMQADWMEFFDGLACMDLGVGLADSRFVWFVGDDAPDRLEHWVDQQPDDAPPSMAIQCPLLVCKASLGGSALMRSIDANWVMRANELEERVKGRAHRDLAWWAQRYAKALDEHAGEGGNEPLRVLIPVSRQTTYLKFAARDLAESFTSRGCVCRVLIERDDSTMMSSSTTLRAIEEFDPDLILSMNYTRSSLGSQVPRDIPHVCWIQDAMAHLFDPKVGESFGDLDFIVGMVKPELVESFGYPKEQTRWMPMVASRSKFESTPRCDGFDTEIAWVTHQSEAPELLRKRMVDEMSINAPDAAPKFVSLLDEVERVVRDEPRVFLVHEMTRMVDEAFFPAGVPDGAQSLRFNMLHSMVIPYAERVFRHQAAQWAANIASRRGWRLKLFGNGWADHRTLGSFAAGPIEHGDALRGCYRDSAVQIHASINQVTHQRVSECLLSGGLPVCRVSRGAFDLMNLQLAERYYRAKMGFPMVGHTEDLAGWRISTQIHEDAASYITDLHRLGLCTEEEFTRGWMGWNLEQLRRAISTMQSPVQAQNASMFASITDLFFTTEAGLESLIERAIEDRDWRDQRINTGVTDLPDELTFDGWVTSVLGLIESRLDAQV